MSVFTGSVQHVHLAGGFLFTNYKNESDFVSDMTDAESPSCYAEVQNENP